MHLAQDDRTSGNRAGLLFALGGFAMLSLGDVVVKSMAGLWPGSAIAAVRYVIGAIGLGVILYQREGRAGFAFPHLRWQVLRGCSVGVSALAGFTALHLMPIGEFTAISFTSPMLTALLAALLLSEKLRRETLLASMVAFAGVLIILRPNFAILGPVALLPVLAATGMALLIIANRKVSGSGSALAMQFTVATVAAVFLSVAAIAGHLSGIALFEIPPMPPSVLVKIVIVAVNASIAHALIYLATTRAGAAAIAPMTYVQLLMAGGLGWLVFGERPDLPSAIGALIIVGAGLYLWRAGRSAAR
ncbi:MAG: EamA family transporter [Novosphingobium sp. 28-62-57]|uniref:DMT family transporter n=1 Tax=unclassified Novosphingobium TaxID=2644732 RepID=UPI000BD33209|nr:MULTISPECIES: DMT family transporter [unclassified Novosphingobium]OYW49517.1 MAG: EamA family transporter [Novosphingobium sp. 12-62-10]OYZ12527.1 MAG: EamA family transporter [Novosphingobium sp. 28-62-57]OYZ97322.1 MAG: EamA family transporter [Novosphingobium sp. 17-62-8]HQS68696.1 DMT family transporter [Novosphingobium sp.]